MLNMYNSLLSGYLCLYVYSGRIPRLLWLSTIFLILKAYSHAVSGLQVNNYSILFALTFTGVRAIRPSGQRMIGVLVGNKSDFREDGALDSRAEVSLQEGQGAATEMGLKYFESSAVSKIKRYVLSSSTLVNARLLILVWRNPLSISLRSFTKGPKNLS
jgi:hypothetical protein